MSRYFTFLIYSVILFLFQEFVFRLAFPVPEITNIDRVNYIKKKDAVNDIPHLRNRKLIYRSKPDTSAGFLHTLNNYGFRDEDWEVAKTEGKKRIIFVGDSFVEGAMARQNMKITDHFKSSLDPETYEVWNAGIIGVGLESYIKCINELVPTFKPDILILVLYSNDAPFQKVELPYHSFEPEFKNTLKPRLATLLGELIDGEQLNPRWKPAEDIMPHIPDPSNPWTHKKEELSPHVRPDIAKYMMTGQFNSFHINWVLKEEYFLKRTVDFTPYIAAINDFLRLHNTQLIVSYVPSRHQVSTYYYEFSKATCQIKCPQTLDLTGAQYHIHRKHLDLLCRELNIPFIDTTPIIQNLESNEQHLYWNYDDHMREIGYEVIGNEIFRLSKDTILSHF